MAAPGLRLSLLMGAVFLIFGVHMSYLPAWLQGRGLSPTEISLTMALPMMLRLVVTPAVAFAADRRCAHRDFMIGAAVCVLVLLLALTGVRSIALLIVLVVVMQIVLQTILPMADTITLAAVRAEGLDYGRIRLWGSISFILATFSVGWAVARNGPEAVLALSITAAALTTAAALWLPRAAPTSRVQLSLQQAFATARDPAFVLFVVTVGLLQASHAVFYIFSVIHWRSQGLSEIYIASLWSIGVVAEIILFWYARRLGALGASGLLVAGGVAGVVRWGTLAGDPAHVWLLPLQILHAGTFAATHLGTMNWIATRIPPSAAGTAQAVVSAFTTGIAMAGATMLAGPLYARFGGQAYLAMAVLAAAGIAAALMLRRLEAGK